MAVRVNWTRATKRMIGQRLTVVEVAQAIRASG